MALFIPERKNTSTCRLQAVTWNWKYSNGVKGRSPGRRAGIRFFRKRVTYSTSFSTSKKRKVVKCYPCHDPLTSRLISQD